MVRTREGMQLRPSGAQEAVQSHINELGFGRFQLMMLVATGGLMMSEGAEVLIMGSVTKLLGQVWDLNGFLKGFMVSMVYVGFAIGNLFAGSLGDRFGRRPTILLSYAVIGIFGFLTSFAESPAVMVFLRSIVGVGVGLGFPCIFSLIPEVVPMHLRGAISSAMIGFMVVGELWASLGVLVLDPNLLDTHGWRNLCRWSALPPMLLLAFCSRYLCESPLFLARQGREEELNEMLGSVAAWNWKKAPPRVELTGFGAADAMAAESDPPAFSWSKAVSKIFSGRYAVTAVVLMVANFTKDFSYFGLNYVFPQYFQLMVLTHPSWQVSTGGEMVVTSLVAFPGVALAVWLTQSSWCGNLTMLTWSSFVGGLAAFGLFDVFPAWLNFPCVCLVKVFALAYFIAVVVNMEVFPTSIRTTAVGLCTCFGRIGSISAPLVFQLSVRFGGYTPFWVLIITFMLVIAVSSRLFLTIETKGKFLTDEDCQSAAADVSYGSADKLKLPS